jgi:sialidase-1
MKTLTLIALAATLLQASEARLEKIDLWTGGEGGYKMYRIPGLVVTKKGTVLAYAEARRFSGNDWDSIDIVLRRSTDGGRAFSPQSVIAHVSGDIHRNPVAMERKQAKPTDITYNNPVAIADRNGTVHFLFCLEYMRVFYMRSTDDGKTFSSPVEITPAFAAFRSDYDWRVVATGPGHGIQLRNGRLIVPIWLALGTGGNGHHPSVAATVYSDDHGQTWHRGAIAVPSTPDFPDPNETTAAQLPDGRVMLNVRTEAPQNRRTVVISPDGATNWSAPRLQEDLPDPICFASLLAVGRNLFFSNPENLTRVDGKDRPNKDRRNLTIHFSNNGGAAWPVKRTIAPGVAGYSDLASLPDRTILCLYETGDPSVGKTASFPDRKLVLARFKLDWVTSGQ